MRIYVASFFNTRERLREPVKRIEKSGHIIYSKWLAEFRSAPDATTTTADYTDDELLGFALRDIAEIRLSDLLICDTADVTPRGGREVEVGLAIGFGVPVWVVGPLRNVFHWTAERRFDSWEDEGLWNALLARRVW